MIMYHSVNKCVSLILLLGIGFVSFSQTNISYDNKVYDESVKTVMFYRAGWEFTYPVLELNSGNNLMLEFDCIGESFKDFSYTIIHCDSEWNPSGLNALEYLDGFEENTILNTESSFNTLIDYTHYTLSIPNDDIRPIISGNYLLLVYEPYDIEKPVLSRRFYVIEDKIDIDAEVKRSTLVSSLNDSQELEITLQDKSYFVKNPQDDLTIKVLQNNISDRSFTRKSPDFIKGNTYEYINARKNVVKGSNEFRYFNSKSIKFVTDRIFSIRYNEPYYIFRLLTEEAEAYLPYTYAQDINGDMLIIAENIEDPKLEAEYVLVDFTLKYDFELTNGEFYVFGALSSWECNEQNRMEYNLEDKAYRLRLLLKQGFYNYEYVFIEENSNIKDLSLTEGNHYETENNYLVFVYYTPQGSQYEHLIGFALLNTLKRL